MMTPTLLLNNNRLLLLTLSILLLICQGVTSFTAPTSQATAATIRRPYNQQFNNNYNTPKISTSLNSASSTSTTSTDDIKSEYDVLIIGSGIGGLSAGALLSHYGYSVAIFESHYAPGGAAHGYSITKPNLKKNIDSSDDNSESGGTFTFDTGPSFFSGLNSNYPAKSSNPLRCILDIINEQVPCIPYTTFGLLFPQGEFIHSSNFGKSGNVIDTISGVEGMKQWKSLMDSMVPLAMAVDAMPTAAIRTDVGVTLTAGMFMSNFAKLNPLENLKLTKPFKSVMDGANVHDQFITNWLDVLCFCLSGVPSDGTITAEMAMMMGEFYDEDAIMDCPIGGAKSIVDALVRGITKNGGQIFLKSHVDEIVIEDGQAVGLRLRKKKTKNSDDDDDRIIHAKKGVISNISVWDMMKSGIVDTKHFPERFVIERSDTPACPSFMHLHVGFKCTREELEQLQAHYIYMDDWNRSVKDEENCALISIPSVHDDSLAPENHAVLHIYTPATERYERWENVKRNSPEYNQLKEERSAFLWRVLEKVIPDIRERAVHYQVGTPLTHQRFLNRYRGTYGPAIYAGKGSFPFPNTPVKNLLVCGDSCFPGIGVPAVAGSGMIAANSVSLDSIGKQLEVLQTLR